MKTLRLLRYYWLYLRWFFQAPGYRLGDLLLGVGEQRRKNCRILSERHANREPVRP